MEVSGERCPICGATTEEDIPAEIFWCDICDLPVIIPLSSDNKNICPLCSGKMRHLATDIRPVFPEERLLLAALLDKPLGFFINRSVWALNSRYYIDGKSINVSAKSFAEVDADSIVARISSANVEISYTRFDNDVVNFVRANRYRLSALKDEAESFVRCTAKRFSSERVVISFSGGKDSTVVADIVTRALNNPSLVHIFGNTTLEFPTTLAYAFALWRDSFAQSIL